MKATAEIKKNQIAFAGDQNALRFKQGLRIELEADVKILPGTFNHMPIPIILTLTHNGKARKLETKMVPYGGISFGRGLIARLKNTTGRQSEELHAATDLVKDIRGKTRITFQVRENPTLAKDPQVIIKAMFGNTECSWRYQRITDIFNLPL